MNTIKFSHDWNKKLSGGNELFTTIRKYRKEKVDYYLNHIEQEFSVYLNEQEICKAELVTLETFKFWEISSIFLFLDTGYTDNEKVDKLFKNFGIEAEDTVIVLLFKKVKVKK